MLSANKLLLLYSNKGRGFYIFQGKGNSYIYYCMSPSFCLVETDNHTLTS